MESIVVDLEAVAGDETSDSTCCCGLTCAEASCLVGATAIGAMLGFCGGWGLGGLGNWFMTRYYSDAGYSLAPIRFFDSAYWTAETSVPGSSELTPADGFGSPAYAAFGKIDTWWECLPVVSHLFSDVAIIPSFYDLGMSMISFKWKRFRKDIILMAVRWYVAYSLSYRDIEELMAERGSSVDYSTVNR